MSELLLRRRALMMVGGGGDYPPGFTKCLCIGPSVHAETTATIRYINTGIVVDPDHTSLVVDFESINQSNGAILSANYDKGYTPAAADSLGWYGNHGGRIGYGTDDLGYQNAIMPVNGVRTVIEYNWKDKFILNHTNSARLSLEGRTYNGYGDKPLCVFLRRFSAYSTTMTGWLYGLTIYYDAEAVLNYVPGIDNEANPCVYDAVARKIVYPVGNAATTYSYQL